MANSIFFRTFATKINHMKYRIVQTGKGFHIQYKFLGLFWRKRRDPYVSEDVPILHKVSRIAWHIYDTNREWCLSTLQEAENVLEVLKTLPIKYLGHSITCGMRMGGGLVYLDSSSVGFKTFNMGAEKLEDLKIQISNYELQKTNKKLAKKKAKRDKKVINVWYQK